MQQRPKSKTIRRTSVPESVVSEAVVSETRDAVAVITMDDGKVNALSPGLQNEIHEHLDKAEHDRDVGAIVLCGRPGVFSAGFDLAIMSTRDPVAIVDMVASGGALVRRLYGLHKPVVAAATGHAIAAGAFMLLGCDVRIGVDTPAGSDGSCKIGMNEVAIGMPVPFWAMAIAMHRLSNRHLNRSMLNARITDGPTAVDVGFLDQVVGAGHVIDTAIAEAQTLAENDASAYTEMISRYRGPVLAQMDAAIAADRAVA